MSITTARPVVTRKHPAQGTQHPKPAGKTHRIAGTIYMLIAILVAFGSLISLASSGGQSLLGLAVAGLLVWYATRLWTGKTQRIIFII